MPLIKELMYVFKFFFYYINEILKLLQLMNPKELIQSIWISPYKGLVLVKNIILFYKKKLYFSLLDSFFFFLSYLYFL